MPLYGSTVMVKTKTSDPFADHSYVLSGYKDRKKRKNGRGGWNDDKKKKKQKKQKTKSNSHQDEPESMLSGLASPRTRQELPSLYNEDLGNQGIKAKRPILSGPQSFKISLTADEERRRTERQMRFASNSGTINGVKNRSVQDALTMGLSSSRENNGGTQRSKKSNTKAKSGDGRLVGTCKDLEKPYLRLTDFPKAEDVRPLEILVKSLAHIKTRYVETEYFEWANEQLKSLRQDITVQGLRNDFVLNVYETHARILLEHGDLNEFNQCQTMIRTLTTRANASSCSSDDCEVTEPLGKRDGVDTIILYQTEDAADEFGAYRLLYALVQNAWSDVNKELANAISIVNKDKRRSCEDSRRMHHGSSASCRHAILVSKAMANADYHVFFRLYHTAPHLSAYLMDFLLKRVRDGAYKRIVAAYRPTISVEHFREELCFADLEETRTFLKKSGAVFVNESSGPPFWVDCKASMS
mmetsp:Transcript_14054/g.21944  ORF Transcript_14054/g.21944 Transcript_14054/m.21944 type:complete len:469 (+) Transcript_14054:236-1642(+)|eukprot:CAMPEP_0195294122 /NCGR_PEP_ID=MMETSP0707-20130614/14145_1 /TAXON_ID=33640 /ORGANISM="Asterionellopsis glacialis, Strain CCMP134" /LENGTH=468 /DNA_ID=CAMNT_0040355013 /DNA_START=148 /DNA_END=1554 /DNA_ORIENTATION=-